MALTTWVATFVVDNGRVTEEGTRLRNFQRRRLDEADVDLHVLQEPQGAKAEELGAQALDAIGRLFLNDRLSLTGALTRALTETHQTLLDWNRRSLPRDQAGIGITAALAGSNVVYVAQAGPSVLFLRRGNRLSRLTPDQQASSPLGEGVSEPALRRIELQDGDLLLGASTVLEEILSQDEIAQLLSRETEDILPDLYLMTRELPAFGCFTITCVPEESAPEYTDDAETETETARAATSPAPPSLPQQQHEARGFAYETGGPSRQRLNGADGPIMVYPPPRTPVDISRPVVNLRNDRATGRNEYARTTGNDRRFNFKLSDARLLQIAAVVAIAVVLIVFVPDLVREGRSEQVGDFINSAQVNLAAADAETDPAQQRIFLEEARRLSNEALRIDETNAAATELSTRASTALQEMNAVFDLSPMTSLSVLSTAITGDLAVEGLTVHGGQAYMLDVGGGRVISMPADGSGAPTTIYQAGETYGETPAQSPVQFAWDGGETDGRLLILDAERKLFEWRPGAEPRPLPLRRTNTWSSVAGMAAYDGNLYVLDPLGNQVHKYLPAAEGYDSEPEPILAAGVDLTDATAFAVDGDIYVAYSGGRVARFSNGEAAPFPLGNIDRPLGAASDIAVVAPAEEVYVADTGNKRVVVAGKDGTFNRQLVANAITDVSAIAVDPTGAQLYVIVGDQLLTAPIVR